MLIALVLVWATMILALTEVNLETSVVYFSKFGDKLMLIQPNLSYRSTSKNTEEKNL